MPQPIRLSNQDITDFRFIILNRNGLLYIGCNFILKPFYLLNGVKSLSLSAFLKYLGARDPFRQLYLSKIFDPSTPSMRKVDNGGKQAGTELCQAQLKLASSLFCF